MKRAVRVLLFVPTFVVAGCDDGAEYSAEPGIEVCEMIVEECGYLCNTDPARPDAERFGCSTDTEPDFSGCGSDIIEREALREEVNPLELSALTAARGVLVGYNQSCESALSSFPVFCYGCE